MRLTHRRVRREVAHDFVARVHRHHEPPPGDRWCIGAFHGGTLHGVAIIGRPIARELDEDVHVEVLRVATDGTKNACSFLYGWAARGAEALGFAHIFTYILASEPGTTLKAVGWEEEPSDARARPWGCATRPRPRTRDLVGEVSKKELVEGERKTRYGRWFTSAAPPGSAPPASPLASAES